MTDTTKRPDAAVPSSPSQPEKTYEDLELEFETLERKCHEAILADRFEERDRLELEMLELSRKMKAHEGNPFRGPRHVG